MARVVPSSRRRVTRYIMLPEVLPAVPELPDCVSPLPRSMPPGTVSIDCTVAEAIDTPDWLPSMLIALLALEVRVSALPFMSLLLVLWLVALEVLALLSMLPLVPLAPILLLLFPWPVPAVLP